MRHQLRCFPLQQAAQGRKALPVTAVGHFEDIGVNLPSLLSQGFGISSKNLSFAIVTHRRRLPRIDCLS
jgi:hypothetical protein